VIFVNYSEIFLLLLVLF